jgi:hypothetical protein
MHLFGYFHSYITIHGFMNVKSSGSSLCAVQLSAVCLGIPDIAQFSPLCHNLAALLPSIQSPNPINLFQVLKYLRDRFLNTFRSVRKIAKNDYQLRYVCVSVRVEQRGSHWRLFVKFGYSSFFENMSR